MSEDIVPQKHCTWCGELKPSTHEYFTYDKSKPSGFHSRCRDCYHNRRVKEDIPSGEKRCSKCKRVLPLTADYFYRRSDRKIGFDSECKDCTAKSNGHTHRPLKPKVAENQKYCRKCLRILDKSEFHKDNQHKDKLGTYCKSCIRKEQGYNKQKVAPPIPEGYKYCWGCLTAFPASPEFFAKHTAIKDGWHHRCRRCSSLKRQAYYQANRESFNRRATIYRRKNRHSYIVYAQKRRARKKELPDTFTKRHWELCLIYWNGKCAVCGYPFNDIFGETKEHADHWIPIKHPDCPGTIPDNMVCLCNSCNSSKSYLHPEEWVNRIYSARVSKKILKRIEAYFEWIVKQ